MQLCPMSQQHHIIKRQVLEVQIGRSQDAQDLQAEMSRIYRQRIVPLVDQYCTELSTPDRIHRIESLDLHLGQIAAENLEDELVAKVRTQLRQLLADQISEQEHVANRSNTSLKTTSELELFSLFAQTGSVPWWVDASQPHILEDCLLYLVHAASVPLRRLIRSLAQEQAALQRIVQYYPDALLSDLSDVLAPSVQLPSFSSFVPELITVLHQAPAVARRQHAQLRKSVWFVIIHMLSLGGEAPQAVVSFYKAILVRIAHQFGIEYAALLSAVQGVVQDGSEFSQSQLRQAVEILSEALPRARMTSEPKASKEPLGPLLGLFSILREMASQLPVQNGPAVLAALEQLERTTPDRESLSKFLSLLQAALEQHPLSPAMVQQWLAELQRLAVAGLAPDLARQVAELTELSAELREASSSGGRTAQPRQTPIDASPLEPLDLLDFGFSDADELYINNAGLVIVWPFLSHFFAHLSLLEDGRFTDTASRHRAAGLLQYLVTEDPVPLEYLLPLNKVLCGLELTEVFDFGPPVSATEAEECSNFLTAVIGQAPVLNNMSAEGFRGTFLLRQGILSSRDGAWLLRVERDTYDIVLDRFPWSLEWVRLPWMESMLRVEW